MTEHATLDIQNLTMRFGGIKAVEDLSFRVREGTIFALIGPNGAGKSTVFNCINGVYKPSAGRMTFQGTDITGLKSHRIARLGIARTFQNLALFRNMTVLENLLLGRNYCMKAGVFNGGFYTRTARNEENQARLRVERIIDFLEIENVRKQIVGSLPFGIQRRVELGRALAADPKLLLLDEPVAGMNAEETEDMVRFILDINEEIGITILLVEHDMGVVMDISDRVAVLNFGVKIAEGPPDEVSANSDVIEAYLGTGDYRAVTA